VREVRSSEEAGGLTQVREAKLGARGKLPELQHIAWWGKRGAIYVI
jgi:hypothetical protein